MEKRLEGRIALITGASRGIGRAVAKRFAQEGAHPILIARTQAALEELDDEIRSETGIESTLIPLDLRDFDAIDKVGATMYERFGSLDVMVANAGLLGVLTPLHHLKPKVWDDVIAVNVTACWRLTRYFVLQIAVERFMSPRPLVTSLVPSGALMRSQKQLLI